MRILMVNKFLYPKGGAETYCLKLGELFEKQGHQVEYFGMWDGERNTVGNHVSAYARNKDFHKKALGQLSYPLDVIYSPDAKKKMGYAIQGFKPDIIHLNNINYQLTPSIIDAAYGNGVPMVQTVHDTQMLCPNHMMLNPASGPCMACMGGGTWQCVKDKCIHGSRAKSAIGAIEGAVYKKTGTYGKISTFICPSRFLKGLLDTDRRFAGKTIAMHNFIEGKPVPQTDGDGKYVLYFGRLSEEKGIRGLMEAARMLPGIPFVFAGCGPLEGHLKDNLPPNAKYLGFLTGKELDEAISGAAFSVCPSIWYENCPMSILESQSLGTPVLANRIGGIPELIEDGVTGVLMDAFTPGNYAANIRALWDNPGKVKEMSRSCIRARGQMPTLESYGGALMGIYRAAIREGSGK